MLLRSRSLSSLLLLTCSALILLGPIGCASHKAREKWWQFWRPRKVDAAMINSADRVIPPPADILSMGEGIPLDPEVSFEMPGAPGDLPEPGTIRSAAMPSELLTVHFAYDSADLDTGAQQALDSNLQWITAHAGVHILIEGHCDERGTQEYNINLGQRRANSVRGYLIERGVSESVLHTISYGEERPVDTANGENSWSKNRRAQFLVY